MSRSIRDRDRLAGISDPSSRTTAYRPHRTLVVYRDSHPAAFAALRELELDMASVTPARERHLLGVIAATWRARDAQRSPQWAGRDPVLRPAA